MGYSDTWIVDRQFAAATYVLAILFKVLTSLPLLGNIRESIGPWQLRLLQAAGGGLGPEVSTS